jgi:hypothetical protein
MMTPAFRRIARRLFLLLAVAAAAASATDALLAWQLGDPTRMPSSYRPRVRTAGGAPIDLETGPRAPVITNCPGCESAAEAVNAIRRQLDEVEKEYVANQAEDARISDAFRAADEAYRLAVRDGNAAAAAKHLKTLEAIKARRLKQIEDYSNIIKRFDALDAEEVRKLEDLIRCEDRCRPTGGTSGGGASKPPGGSGQGTRHAICSDCILIPDRIKEVEAELETLRNTIDNIQQQQQELEDAKEKAATPAQASALQGQLDTLNGHHEKAVKQEKEKLGELESLHKQMDECDGCQTGFRWTDPKVLAGFAGAGALVAIAGGGDTAQPPAITAPPPTAPPAVANPSPAPSPAPPTPQPDPLDRLMGVYLVQSCVCELNPAGYDAILRVCESVRQLRFTRTGANTVRVEGDAPLLTSEFILDANAQTVDANAMGMAGPLSAALRYAGAFGQPPSPNLSLSLTYGINNSSTRYRIMAVKQ